MTKTLVSMLIDESGSMGSIKDDVIGGFNEYVGKLKEDKEGEYYMTLTTFDSTKCEPHYVGKAIKEVPDLNSHTYIPGMMTPLLDAISKTVASTEKHLEEGKLNPDQVLFVVYTDGHENDSREMNKKALSDLIKRKEKEGWSFVFMGADIDAFAEAGSIGISQEATISTDKSDAAQSFRHMSSATMAYNQSGTTGSAGAEVYTSSWTEESEKSEED